MAVPLAKNEMTPDPWGSFEPYVQLVRSLLPRASGVSLFDASGAMRWSSETTTGPDFYNLVEDALTSGGPRPQGPGMHRMLDGTQPVYLFWIRDETEELIGIVAVMCKQHNGMAESEGTEFSFKHALLRPVLECLRRDLLSRAAIDQLSRTVTSRDRDLELLLADGTDRPTGDGADELKGILKQAIEHVNCSTAALIVPDKSIATV